MARKIHTFSIDEDVYQQYIELCKKHGIVMSRQVENFMREMIKGMKK